MKAIYKVLIIFLTIIHAGFSQSSNKEIIVEKSNKKANSSMIMAKTMKAYQIKSENKVQDFYSYLNILGKTDIKTELKQHTITEVKKLFREENVKIPNFLGDSGKTILLDSFLLQLSKSKEFCSFSIENLEQSYVQSNDVNHSWIISYTLNLSLGKSKYSFKNVMQNVKLEQEEKLFGKNSKTILNTRLDAIWLK
jgi:hypothetical protein